MFSKFSEEAQKILLDAKKQMIDLKHPYIGSEHLFLSILKNKNSVSTRLKEYGINYETIKKEIINIIGIGTITPKFYLYTPLLKKIIENSIIFAKDNNDDEIYINHLFMAILEEGEGIAIRILLSLNINIEELYEEFVDKKELISVKKNKNLLLYELGFNLTKEALENPFDPVIGRNDEVKRLIEILSRRNKNNPILIGEAGVGKTAIVEELANLIVNKEVPRNLINKTIISLDMTTLVAGTKYRGEFEEKMKKIIKELEDNDDILIFIDEIHTLVGAGGAEGAIDASNILKPALARGKIKCIGATTNQEYKKHIENDKALDRRFQKIKVDEPNIETTYNILKALKPIYEAFHGVEINDECIKSICDMANEYIHLQKNPDKSIDVLDEVCAKVSLMETKVSKKLQNHEKQLKIIEKIKNDAIVKQNFMEASKYRDEEKDIISKIQKLEKNLYNSNKTKLITINDIAEIINAKTKIPIHELLKDNDKIIDTIKKEYESNIYGQEHLIKPLLELSKRNKFGNNKLPLSILIAGPSGVGKTKIADTFSKSIYSKNVLKLNMSDYSDSTKINKLIGSTAGYVGYNDNKNEFEKIRNNPYTAIIFDEIEYAHSNIINLINQIIENGQITDAMGNEIYFDNTMIIMTTNILNNSINVGFNTDKTKANSEYLEKNFSKSLLSKINKILYCDKLNKENIKTMLQKEIDLIQNQFKNKGITVKYDNNIIEELINLSDYEQVGARKIGNIINNNLYPLILDQIENNSSEIIIKSLITS